MLRSIKEKAALGGAALVLTGSVMTASAIAGEFKLTPSLSVSESVTDNARQAQPGQREADIYTTVSPGVSMAGVGRRLNFNLNYAFNSTSYVDNSDLDRRNHNLAATGTAELLQDMLFVDSRASISQALISNTGARGAVLDSTNPANRTTVRAFSLAPYLRNHLGSYANLEYRYEFALTDSGGLADSLSHRMLTTAKSGENFQRLKWTLTADVQHADRGGSPGTGGTLLAQGQESTSDTKLFKADGEYRLDDWWSLTAGGGYEETQDTTLIQSNAGPVYNGGFRFTPSPRTALAISYNHRNQSDFASGSLSYKATERLTFDVSYDETLQVSEAQRAQNLNFLTVDQFGNFVDTRTAQAFQLNNNNFALNDNVVRRKTAAVRTNLLSGRDTYSLDLSHQRSITEATGIEQVAISVAANWARTISDQNSLNVTLRFLNTDFGTTPSRNDNTENVSVSFTHNFTPTLSGVMSYSLLARQSSGATPAVATSINSGDLVENLFTIGLRKSF